TVDAYTVSLSGAQDNTSTTSKTEFGDSYTITTTSHNVFRDDKTYTNGQFDWIHSESADSSFTRGGFRAVDRNLQGEVDGLVSARPPAAAANAPTQSLIGNYPMTGAQSSNDRLEETGSYPDGTVTRARLTVSDSTEKQRGVLLTFGWTQTVQAH